MNPKNTFVDAIAEIRGGNGYPDISGTATFMQTESGVFITINVSNLPKESVCDGGWFALHIHEGESCTGSSDDQFSNAKTHYNASNCPHPYHAGDLPPLLGNNGFAYMSVLTNRFTVNDIINTVIVIHERKDDFTTQPSGNAGTKIACGRIIKV